MKEVETGQRIEILDVTQAYKREANSPQRHKVYIRSVKGRIENLRRYTGLFSLLVFLCLPWLQYNHKQAVLLDFVAQKFHLFGITLWPQDLTVLAWLFMVAAFALFFVTAIWGRVWCGFICPQTVFTFLFVWVEEKIEGQRNKRIHLDQQDISVQKVLTKLSKHGIWILLALLTATTFVGYFMPIRELSTQVVTFDLNFWPGFYILLFALCTYGNAGWLREIMCTHICPYSRFQSSMFDEDTYTVTYNAARGEGRGPRPKKMLIEERHNKGLGDCIDCNLCVQVCPTGIDIRNGLQYECINCGACVDACNGVMTKMGYHKNLIAYTSANNLKAIKTRLIRPKVLGYFVVLLAMIAVLAHDILTIEALDLNVIRDRNVLYRETLNGNIENVYTLVVMNKTQSQQSIDITIEGLDNAKILNATPIQLGPSQVAKYPITLQAEQELLKQRVTPFLIKVTNQDGDSVSSEATFIRR